MQFNDIDRQVVEESFEINNKDNGLKWVIDPSKIKRNSDDTLVMEVMLFANDYQDLLGDIEVQWRSLYGTIATENISPSIKTVPNPKTIQWEDIIWEFHERYDGMRYAYDEDSNVALLMINT